MALGFSKRPSLAEGCKAALFARFADGEEGESPVSLSSPSLALIILYSGEVGGSESHLLSSLMLVSTDRLRSVTEPSSSSLNRLTSCSGSVSSGEKVRFGAVVAWYGSQQNARSGEREITEADMISYDEEKKLTI